MLRVETLLGALYEKQDIVAWSRGAGNVMRQSLECAGDMVCFWNTDTPCYLHLGICWSRVEDVRRVCGVEGKC